MVSLDAQLATIHGQLHMGAVCPAVRGIYLLLIQRGEGRRLEGELEGSRVVATQLRRELNLRGHGVVGAEGVVATGTGDGHLRIGQVLVQALVELVLVLTANLHAHDGGVAVLTNLSLVIAAACENVLELLLSAGNVLGRECVEETCLHGTVQAQGGSHLHALHRNVSRRDKVNRKNPIVRARRAAIASAVVRFVATVLAVLHRKGHTLTFRRAQQGAIQSARDGLLNLERSVVLGYFTTEGQISAACAKNLLELIAQVLRGGSLEEHGATNFFLSCTSRCGRSVTPRFRRVQTLLQLGAFRLDLIQVGIHCRGSFAIHDFLGGEGNHNRVTTVLLVDVHEYGLEAAVLDVLRRDGGAARVFYFLLAKLHSGFATAAVEYAVLVGGFNNAINNKSFGEPVQQVFRAEVFLHLNTLHQTLVRVDDANLRGSTGTSSLQDRSNLGPVLIHRGEGNGEGRTCLVTLRLNTTVFQALGQVLTHGRIQRLSATLNLVLVVLHIKGNQHGAGTLLGALKAKLSLNLRTAGAQNQGGNGQQNRQEHPALTSRRARGVSHRVHTRLPSGE